MTRAFLLGALLGSAASLAMAEAPRVVADIAPVHSLVAQVMEGVGEPVLLLPPGADPHHFQLRPSQARDLAGATLAIRMGGSMTPWLDRALEGTDFAGRDLALLAVPGTFLRDYGDEDDHDHHAAHDDDDHEGHDHDDHDEDHAGDDHDGHDHSGTDPHAWLDPGNAGNWLVAIADALSEADPANAAAYRANAEAAQVRVSALDAELAVALAPHAERPLVFFHDAYGYFTAHYGLATAGTVAAGDAAAPGAESLRRLRAELVADRAACVFPEVAHDPRLALTVAEGTGIPIGAPLDPEGTGIAPGPELYGTLMRGLAQAIADCLD